MLWSRVVRRLNDAEARETDLWIRDDIKIAKLTVVHAAKGDAVGCSPHVLACYEVLGKHPDKVWPAIQKRREALGPVEAIGAPPKKPAQSVKLWSEKTNAARAINPGGAVTVLREPTTTLPMAAPSIAALYPKSDATSSAKSQRFSYEEMLSIVEFSGAPHSIRQGTLSALKARGRWPKDDGDATGIVCVSLIGMMFHGVCCRSTARWRARRACKLGYWKQLRPANSWSNCPKCSTARAMGTCEQCGYRGRSRTPEGKANFDEFCRPFMYEIDIEKFRSAPRPREIHQFDARTYAEYKQSPRHSAKVTEMPRKPSQPDKPEPPPAAPVRQPAAEHAHRDTQRPRTVVNTEISTRSTKAAELLMEMCGLADEGAIPQMAISIMAEAKFRGVEIEDAGKLIAECAIRDQKRGITLTRFYFRDLKWRSNDGRQTSTGEQRSDRIKRNILDGFAANARPPNQPDGPEREK